MYRCLQSPVYCQSIRSLMATKQISWLPRKIEAWACSCSDHRITASPSTPSSPDGTMLSDSVPPVVSFRIIYTPANKDYNVHCLAGRRILAQKKKKTSASYRTTASRVTYLYFVQSLRHCYCYHFTKNVYEEEKSEIIRERERERE